VDAVLRYLGFGSDGVVPIATDNEGRIRPTALADNLRKVTGPSIVCLQAANVNSGSCDPFPRGDRGRQGTLGLGACRRRVWAVGRRKPDHPTPRRRCGRGQLVGHRRHKWRRRVVRRATPGRERPPREAKAPSRGLLLGGVQQRVHADTADMSGCCDSRGCNDMFGPRFARHLASRYRKRGLDKTAARMVAYLVDRGLDGASVLEIGGGVGDIQLELLGQGASRTTNLELVDAYDADATDLAKSAGLRDRMTRLRVDIAATPDEVETHDVVVLHRVVCCYPDYERLLTAAADHAKRLLVFSHPRRNWVSWTFTHLQNVSFRLVGKSFRTFAHPPAAMVAVAEVRGMHTEYSYRGPVWQVVGLARATTAGR